MTLDEVISKIPPTWACIECGREFDNSPDGEPPYGCRTAFANAHWYVEGQICKKCYVRSEPK